MNAGRLFKLMYLADNEHLRRWGRFVFNDTYVTLKHGPAPLTVLSVLQVVRDTYNYKMGLSVDGNWEIKVVEGAGGIQPLRMSSHTGQAGVISIESIALQLEDGATFLDYLKNPPP